MNYLPILYYQYAVCCIHIQRKEHTTDISFFYCFSSDVSFNKVKVWELLSGTRVSYVKSETVVCLERVFVPYFLRNYSTVVKLR